MYPITIRAVYAELTTLADKKPASVLIVLDDEGALTDRTLMFARKSLSGANIGGVYDFEQTEESKFALAERVYVGLFQDTGERAKWQLAARAQQVIEERGRIEKSDKDMDAALEMLAPLRSIYMTAMPMRQRAMELVLLNYLRRGTK